MHGDLFGCREIARDARCVLVERWVLLDLDAEELARTPPRWDSRRKMGRKCGFGGAVDWDDEEVPGLVGNVRFGASLCSQEAKLCVHLGCARAGVGFAKRLCLWS